MMRGRDEAVGFEGEHREMLCSRIRCFGELLPFMLRSDGPGTKRPVRCCHGRRARSHSSKHRLKPIAAGKWSMGERAVSRPRSARSSTVASGGYPCYEGRRPREAREVVSWTVAASSSLSP
jgi:hypothetical protein